MRLRRSPRLPDEARAELSLVDGERVIACGQLRGGGWVVATERALVLADGRVPWSEVAHAQWYDEERLLAIDPVPGVGRPSRLRFAEPGRVPEAVHERVMASIVLTRKIAVPGGAARVVARREEGSAELAWQVLPDAGTDLTTPAAKAAVEQALARIGRELA